VTLEEAKAYVEALPTGIAGIRILAILDREEETAKQLRITVHAVGFTAAGEPLRSSNEALINRQTLELTKNRGSEYLRFRVEHAIARLIERAYGFDDPPRDAS